MESETVSVNLDVTAIDDPPTVVNDSYSVNEDTDLVVTSDQGVLANDSDPDGGLTATLITAPVHGTLSLNADGSFNYSPTPNFAGEDNFTYRASDGVSQVTASVTITVVDQPDPPTAVDDAFEVADDGSSHVLDVLSNDTFSPDINDTLSVVSVTQGSQGGVVSLTDGQIAYQPPSGFTGTETFQYTIEDSDQLQSTATVTVTVTEGTGNILSGFVYIDDNDNGQRDTGELGVPGVLISLSGSSSGGESIQRSVMTNDDGLYLFEDLPAGTYQILERQPTAMADGSESTSVTGADLATNDRIANLTISGHKTLADNNFGELYLQPAYISIAWFFSSSTSTSQVFRETMAMAEERVGENELAQAIRDGGNVPPDTPNRATVGGADAFYHHTRRGVARDRGQRSAEQRHRSRWRCDYGNARCQHNARFSNAKRRRGLRLHTRCRLCRRGRIHLPG